MTYLDYSATTPVSDEVLESFCEVSRKYIGNPNSLHRLGTEANEMINKATNQTAKLLNVKPTEIIYTSGSSESNNLAIKGIALKYKNRGNHIITVYRNDFTVFFIGKTCHIVVFVFEYLDNFSVLDDCTAHFLKIVSSDFPKLTRP